MCHVSNRVKMEILKTRNLFLRAIAAVYLFAFCSLYLQIRGLYGTDGILPAHTQINLKDKRNFFDKFLEKPTILHLAPKFGLNVSLLMELVALVGISASFLGVISQRMCNTLNFFMLWISYLSLYQVGQTFMHFQWDIMLLETGLITVLVAPLFHTSGKTATPKDRLSFWLVRWLFFRLMFASGVVKLTSKCPTWWGLTALTVHYESQCIPTALAWYMHQLPVWFQKLSVVATFIIEILLPFLFFVPFRQLRLFANYSQILLQLLIIASGNYNFFNLLTLSLCFSLFDDYHLFSSSKRRSSSIFEKMATISVIALLIISLNIWFGVELGNGEDLIRSKINFSIQDFDEFLKAAVPASVVMGTSSFVYTSISCLYSLVFRSKKSFLQFMASSIQFVLYFFMTAVLFGISLVPYTTLDRATQSSLPPVLVNWYGDYQGFNVAGSYGLFRSMTGVGGRPELILEGAAHLEGPWVEIPFKYKPGALDRPCPFIVPHQPRLDWQMWFAALSNYHQNPWLTSLAFRLLTNKTDVIKLLDTNIYNEFETDWPPKYVRGSLYTYHYTSLNNNKEKENWWRRSRVEDYLPIFTADHAPLLEYLAKLKIIRHLDIPIKNAGLAAILDSIWNYFTSIEPHLVIWGLLTAALVIIRIK